MTWNAWRGLCLTTVFGGCIPYSATLYNTPPSLDLRTETAWPAEVDYELLGPTEGQACGDLNELRLISAGGRSGKEEATGPAHPLLLAEARWAALEAASGADGLMQVRAKIETDGNEQCVTIQARAWRVKTLHARPAEATFASSPVGAAPPRATVLTPSEQP